MPEFEELKDFISDSEVGFQVSQELKTDISSKIKQLQQLKGIEQIICFIKILSDLMQNKTLHIPSLLARICLITFLTTIKEL